MGGGAAVDDKLLCRPEDKRRLENRNADDQHEYITELVMGERRVTELREAHVRELKALAIREIFGCRDAYRTAMQQVYIANSPHKLPEAATVPGHVLNAVDWINEERGKRSALECAAYALWRFNWIHPFAGGNGRTSRALAYLIVCLEHGAMLPGTPTMASHIYTHRDEYIRALRATDESERVGALDLTTMAEFLQRMVTKQLASAIDALARPSR